MLDRRKISDGRNEILADTLDGPRPRGAELAGANIIGDDGALRVSEHELECGLHIAEELGEARDRSGRSDAAHDGVDILPQLPPDLRSGPAHVAQRVAGAVGL